MITKINLKLPASWNELTDRQLSKLAALFFSGNTGVKFDIKIWVIVNDIRWWQLRRMARNILVLRHVALSELKKNYDFIYSKNARTKFPADVKNNNGIIHFPPLNNISNLTVEEFAIADDLHIKFRETKNTEYLQMLVAVLYVSHNGKRPEFVREILPQLSDSFSKMKTEDLLAIELAYFGSKNTLLKRFPKAFPKGKEGDEKLKSNKKYGFAKVILEMTKGDLSKLKSIQSVNIYTFLEQFQQDIINAKEQQHAKNR
jgi:hypothetical protein